MNDYIVRATAADHSIRAFAITSKNIVEEARKESLGVTLDPSRGARL